jgi:hypothetical protein
MCLAGDSVQPEYRANVRDPVTGDWEQDLNNPLNNDYDDSPTTDLDYLKNLAGYERNAFTPPPDPFSHITFQDALNHIDPNYRITAAGKARRDPASGDITAHDGQGERPLMDVSNLTNVASGGTDLAARWGEVKDEVVRLTQHFNSALDSLMDDKQHWDGKTKIKAFENVRNSFVAPEKISASAGGMQILVDAFARTIDYVYKNIEGNRPNYEYNVKLTHDEDHDEYVDQFNRFARDVMGGPYTTNIQSIAGNNPKFTTGELPNLGGEPPPDPRKQQLGDGTGVPPYTGGGTPPRMPDIGDPKMPTRPSLPTIPPSGLDDLPARPPGPDGFGDPTQAASNATPSGLGGPPPAGGTPQTPKGKDPREGALGLGPKGLSGPLKKAGGAGGGGGAGRGPLGAKPVTGRLTSPPVTPVARAGLAGPAPGAGLGAGAGAPGMMPPPAAGQRGDANGKGHQTMKALRRKKTGEEVMGKADAVVPVVGETERQQPAQPEPEDDVRPDRRRVADQPVPRIASGDVRQVP